MGVQVDPGKYKGLVGSIKTILAEEGTVGIWKGWLPTAIGYSLQGCFKFGLYEYFKFYRWPKPLETVQHVAGAPLQPACDCAIVTTVSSVA